MSLDPALRERLESIVRSDRVVVFMKGTPDAPQCGFSAQVVSILGRLIPSYGSFDVLSDREVREGIKEFSDWPTIPQLYVAGEFQGGCDIVKELYASGELQQLLGVPIKPSPRRRDRDRRCRGAAAARLRARAASCTSRSTRPSSTHCRSVRARVTRSRLRATA
jgi:monothiol glutaredoxin